MGLLLISCVVVWWFPYFPSLDGPVHFYNAGILLDLLMGETSIHNLYVELNPEPGPTWMMHQLMIILVLLFPAAAAEKVLVTLVVLSLPLSLRYLLRSIDEKAIYLSVLGFPMVFGKVLHLGFYSYCLGMSASLVFFGYWLRYHDDWHRRRLIQFALLGMLSYLLHVVSFGMAIIGMALLGLIGMIQSFRQPLSFAEIGSNPRAVKPRQRVQQLIHDWVLPPLLALLPALLMAVYFLTSRQSELRALADPIERLWHFGLFSTLVSFVPSTAVFTAMMTLSLMVMVGIVIRRRLVAGKVNGYGLLRWHDNILLVLVTYLLMVMFLPDTQLVSANGMRGGAFIEARIQLYPWFMLLLWLGCEAFSERTKGIFIGCILLAFAGLLLCNTVHYTRINDRISEYLSIAAHVQPGHTLLPVHLGRTSDVRYIRDPMLHSSARLANETGLLTLDNYEPNMGYFPLLYKAQMNPYLGIGNFEEGDLSGLETYISNTQVTVDFILVWNDDWQVYQSDHLDQVLAARYELVATSAQGRAQLYRLSTPNSIEK